MQVIYSDDCIDVSTVRCWTKKHKNGELGNADLSNQEQ